MARMLDDLGAELAVNLDGGGSTTMVARGSAIRSPAVRNVPSDGNERSDPNGVGVFVSPGNGKRRGPGRAAATASVFPGLHRTLTVAAIDDHQTPVELDGSDVRWTAEAGTVAGGLFTAPERRRPHGARPGDDGHRRRRPRSSACSARLRSLELSSRRLSIPEPSSAPTILTVTGRDAQGYTAPVEAADLELDYDPAVVKIQPAGDALKITPVAKGGTLDHDQRRRPDREAADDRRRRDDARCTSSTTPTRTSAG